MSAVAERFRAFLAEVPHWTDLLADEVARHVIKHDTRHPVFYGSIDWHSACHGVWALIAQRAITKDVRHAPVVDRLLQPEAIAREAADLSERSAFEMPYGRAWFLRLALEDKRVTGSARLGVMADEVADSLVAYYQSKPPDAFAREYANPSWALINLLDFARELERHETAQFTYELARQLSPALSELPHDEWAWPDFMAVVPSLCELVVRSGAATCQSVLERAGEGLLALRPVEKPERSHHYALNFSRAWSLFAIYAASDEEAFLTLALDHMETSLMHPSWWCGDYRTVSHWVPQFGIFALKRAIDVAGQKGISS
jgi:hypothetical protein